jgi:hypothetical protein
MPAHDRARTLEEALTLIITGEYDTVVLHTRTPGRDDYGLIDYLAGTWPDFLRTLTVLCVSEREPASARRRRPQTRRPARLEIAG